MVTSRLMHTIMKYQPAGKPNPEWPLERGWTFILSLQLATQHKSLKTLLLLLL
jgi:hypothetical protein